jgi:hypothetical protein
LEAAEIQHEIVEPDFLLRHECDLAPQSQYRKFCSAPAALSSRAQRVNRALSRSRRLFRSIHTASDGLYGRFSRTGSISQSSCGEPSKHFPKGEVSSREVNELLSKLIQETDFARFAAVSLGERKMWGGSGTGNFRLFPLLAKGSGGLTIRDRSASASPVPLPTPPRFCKLPSRSYGAPPPFLARQRAISAAGRPYQKQNLHSINHSEYPQPHL